MYNLYLFRNLNKEKPKHSTHPKQTFQVRVHRPKQIIIDFNDKKNLANDPKVSFIGFKIVFILIIDY